MSDLVILVKRPVTELPNGKIGSWGVKWWGKGAYVAEEKEVTELRAERFIVRANDLIYNDMWARHGSLVIVPPAVDGYFEYAHCPAWEIDLTQVYPRIFRGAFVHLGFGRLAKKMHKVVLGVMQFLKRHSKKSLCQYQLWTSKNGKLPN